MIVRDGLWWLVIDWPVSNRLSVITEVEEQTSEEEEDRQVHHLHSSSMVL